MKTTTRKTAPKQRTMQFFPNARLLFIQQGNKTDGYLVEKLDAANSYQLMKPDGTVYNVQVNGNDSLCDCIGFEHRGMNTRDGKGCKHVAALAKLLQLGKIEVDKVEQQKPQRFATVGEHPHCDFQDP